MTAPSSPTTRLALLALLAPLSATAQTTHVWSGGAVPLGDRNWTNSGNWVGGVPPKSFLNTEVILQGAFPFDQNPIVDEPWSIRKLVAASTTNSATLLGEPLTLGAGGISLEGANFFVLENKLNIQRDQTWTRGPGISDYRRLIVRGDIEFVAPPSGFMPFKVTIPDGTSVFINDDVIGTGTFEATSGGSITVGSNNTTTSAPDCTFLIQDDAAMRIDYGGNTNAQRITLGSTADLELLSAESVLALNSLQGSGNILFDSGQSGSSVSTLNHTGAANETYSGNLVGGPTSNRKGRLIKSGTGNLTLNRADSSGSLIHLQLSGGRLILDNNTRLDCQTLSGSAILDTRPGSTFRLLEGDPSLFQGAIIGGGDLTISSGQSLTLQSSALHDLGITSLTGDLTLQGSEFHTRRLISTGNAILGANSQLRFTDTVAHSFTGEIRNTGTPASPDGLVVVANPTTVNLSGTAKQHRFASLALVSGATLRVSNQGELLVSSYSGSGGTLRLTENSTAFLVENPSATFPMRIDAADGNVVIPIGARFQLAATGKSHLIGHLDIGNRGLDLGGSSSLTLGRLSGSIALSINSGSSLTLADFHDSPFTGAFINGAAGGGSLSLTSAGTKIFRAGGFTGTTTLGGTAGAIYQTLPGTAPNGPLTVSANAKLEAANLNNTSTNLAGVFEIRSVPSPDGPVHGGCATGTFTQAAGSRTILTINDRPTRPLGFGKIVASGDISLANAAILEVNFNNNFGAMPGDSWTLFSTTGGKFTQVNLPANRTIHAANLPPNTQLIWVKTPTALSLQLVSTDTDPPGYYTWATANNLTPANRGPFLDPDNDLIPNWREYLLGLNPLASAHPSTPAHEALIQAGQPIVRFRLSPAADFTNDFEVQGSSDLGITDPWNSSKATLLGSGTLPDSFLYRDYRFHLPSSSAPRGFLRIRYKGLTSHPND